MIPIGLMIVLASPLQQAAAIPPPIPQATADCARPVYATDQLVCGDPPLRALDATMRQRLRQIALPSSSWLEDQTAWLRRRSLCAFSARHRACTIAAYRDRLAVLGVPLSAPPDARQVRCDDPGIVTRYGDDRLSMFYDAKGALVAVASSATATDDWRPFVNLRGRGRRLTLQNVTGQKTRCTMFRP